MEYWMLRRQSMKIQLALVLGLIILFSAAIVAALEAEDGLGGDNSAADHGGAQPIDGSEIMAPRYFLWVKR